MSKLNDVDDLKNQNEELNEELEAVTAEKNRLLRRLELVADTFASHLGLDTPYAKRRWIEAE
jgi:hypothetical protein